MKIDFYTHFLPPKYRAHVEKLPQTGSAPLEYLRYMPTLWNLDERFRIMDKFPDVAHVLTLAAHTPSDIVGPKEALELSMRANDELAELVYQHPDRFAGAAAVLPLNDMDAALKELERAVNELHLRGVLVRVPINDRGPDAEEFWPLWEAMAAYNLPVWLHPQRRRDIPDYASEKGDSKYMIWHLWGIVYETTVAMTRLAFSGVFDKYPDLKFVTHHCGAMVPFFSDRIDHHYDQAEMRQGPAWNFKKGLREKPVDYFRKFYNDTVVNGNTSALMCGYEFFGADHLLFATDFPFDAQLGVIETRSAIEAIERMAISEADKRKIFYENARRIAKLPV